MKITSPFHSIDQGLLQTLESLVAHFQLKFRLVSVVATCCLLKNTFLLLIHSFNLHQIHGCKGTLKTVSYRFNLLHLVYVLARAREKFHPQLDSL